MALPVVLINSVTGNDAISSGAGPATPINGSAASVDGTGLVVTLDGSPSLTQVQTDGSHVLFLDLTGSGARNFSKIVAKDQGASTVTVADPFTALASGRPWAIGGKRSTIGGTYSSKLLSTNNSQPGDAMPGWTIRCELGHVETFAATLPIRRSGDSTSGHIIFEGEGSDASQWPILSCSSNATFLSVNGSVNFIGIRKFNLRCTAAAKNSAIGLQFVNTSNGSFAEDLRIGENGNGFLSSGIFVNGTASESIRNVEVRYCGIGFNFSQSMPGVVGLRAHHNISHGFQWSAGYRALFCLSYLNGGAGYRNAQNLNQAFSDSIFAHNLSYGNGSHGFEWLAAHDTATPPYKGSVHLNNIFAANLGYGLAFAGNDAYVRYAGGLWRGNQSYGNSLGRVNPTTLGDVVFQDDLQLDPQFVDAANGDFRLGTNYKAAGWPQVIAGLPYSNYIDPGPLQRLEGLGGLSRARLVNAGGV